MTLALPEPARERGANSLFNATTQRHDDCAKRKKFRSSRSGRSPARTGDGGALGLVASLRLCVERSTGTAAETRPRWRRPPSRRSPRGPGFRRDDGRRRPSPLANAVRLTSSTQRRKDATIARSAKNSVHPDRADLPPAPERAERSGLVASLRRRVERSTGTAAETWPRWRRPPSRRVSPRSRLSPG
jgi:hypothetical protein